MDIQSPLSINTQANSATTDGELIAMVRSGNVDAFEFIMRRHNQRLFRIARSILQDDHESMDVVQETYIKAYYQLHQFKGPEGFSSWLSRIASNEAMMRIRKSRRISYTLDDGENNVHDIQSPEPDPLDNIANRQLRNLLEDAIDKLPLDYRCVYVMRAIQQLSTKETAMSLDVTEDIIKTRLLRAKRSLQKELKTHMEKAELNVFEFAGTRCDWIVNTVMTRLHTNKI